MSTLSDESMVKDHIKFRKKIPKVDARINLSDDDVCEIRRRLAKGEKCTPISHDFNVSPCLIYRIRSGERRTSKRNAIPIRISP